MLEWRGTPVVTDDDVMDASGAQSVVAVVVALVRELRLARRLTQCEMAWRCGVGNTVLNKIERGHREPDFSLLIRLCSLVGVRLSDVVRLAEDEAFPIEPLPWATDPTVLLRQSRQHLLALRGDAIGGR